jgi:CubicO group peptidase (beta-lactamase class C family)
MSDLGGELDALASGTGFSGVVRIDQSDRIELARAYGLAHRGFEIPNAVDTRFGLASGAKGFTALAVVSLIEEGVLELSTPARSVLGSDLPVIDDGVRSSASCRTGRASATTSTRKPDSRSRST